MSITKNMIIYLFDCIEPFRSSLLCMLRPFDIARLLLAVQCKVTNAERDRYMNILDEIFEDSSPILAMQKSGLRVRMFGADLVALQDQLMHPNTCMNFKGLQRPLHVFILVNDIVDSLATLVRDYRPDEEQGFVPDGMPFSQLQEIFGDNIADQISSFSPFILCAPYLTGSMPDAVPGWIPMFNTRPFINVCAYISTYNDCNGRLLLMDRTLMGHVFGYNNSQSPFLHIVDSTVPCYNYHPEGLSLEHLRAELSLNTLQDIFGVAMQEPRRPNDDYLVVNTLHPLNASITIRIKQ